MKFEKLRRQLLLFFFFFAKQIAAKENAETSNRDEWLSNSSDEVQGLGKQSALPTSNPTVPQKGNKQRPHKCPLNFSLQKTREEPTALMEH